MTFNQKIRVGYSSNAYFMRTNSIKTEICIMYPNSLRLKLKILVQKFILKSARLF